ncbi:MAG: M15 family metallopeptidase [Rhizobiaceae bacterium]
MLATGATAAETSRYGAEPADLTARLEQLVAAYPATIAGFDAKSLILKDGTRLPLSDGRTDKSFDQMLDSPDIGDMLAQPYPAGQKPAPPPLNFDPGRVRPEALFRALYGDCRKGEAGGRMRKVAWVPAHGGGTVSITMAQGADKALDRVSRELDRLPARFGKYLVPSAGTYNCRPVAGTSRWSMHAYGAAIDLNTAHSAYWKWNKAGADGTWSNRIPEEIVAIFEKHGFIWGGRWYHYDTMHFEYRPELLAR